YIQLRSFSPLLVSHPTYSHRHRAPTGRLQGQRARGEGGGSSEKMVDVSRVQKELTECNRDSDISGVSIALHDGGSSITHLTGTIAGPRDSPYEGGTFRIDIRLPGGYPFEPPKMQFITKVWHPNISSQNGAICLDILKDQWSPALTLKTALLSLQALLSAPAPDDPQDAVVAQQYLRDKATFVSTARYWTEAFAKSDSTGMEEKV
uniref:E2 ubiquitin-conjugating enzyme n=1 Tax=Aegilops tauschii subsp. strangulata TaxID=200361 RepID=A0A453GDP2_AEGTS